MSFRFQGASPRFIGKSVSPSPALLTEASTRFTGSPQSLATPSPTNLRSFRSDSVIDIAQSLSSLPLYSDDTYENPTNSVDVSQETEGFPQYSYPFLGKPKNLHCSDSLRLMTASCQPRVGAKLQERLKLATHNPRIVDLEADLALAHSQQGTQSKRIKSLQVTITHLEDKAKTDKSTIANLRLENQLLTERLRRSEHDFKAKLTAEVDHLTKLLEESKAKMSQFHRNAREKESRNIEISVVKPLPTEIQGSNTQEFALYLIAENERIVQELNHTKHVYQSELSGLLSSLASELSSIRTDLDHLSNVLRNIKAGEAVSMAELLDHKNPETAEPGHVTMTCKEELHRMKETIVSLKKLASEFYAEQCGQICNTQ